jgi:hypothetical protein
VDNQVEILDEYITTCMLAAEVTIHCHNLEDFSPKKVEAANMEKYWRPALQANQSKAQVPTVPAKKYQTSSQTWKSLESTTHHQS